MAKILLGATLADARGSVGGLTYTKGRFGAVARIKVSPVQPRTASVLTQRGLLALLSKRWFSTLTDAERLGWVALAIANPRTNVFGNSITLTGLQMYASVNRNIQQTGQPIIDTAPANLDVDGLSTLSFVPDSVAGTIDVTFTPTPTPANHFQIYEATLQVNAGRNFVSSYYRQVEVEGPVTASPNDIFADYIAVWGALRLGQKITLKVSQVNSTNGAKSTPLVATATVV